MTRTRRIRPALIVVKMIVLAALAVPPEQILPYYSNPWRNRNGKTT